MNDDWFTVEKIDSRTYVISEYKHYEKTHCYLVMGNQRAALIDTGLGISNIHKDISEITRLPILVITTHVHWDHIGGHKYFKNFAVHQNDIPWICDEFPLPLSVVKHEILKCNDNLPNDFNIESYKTFKGNPTVVLKDNDVISLGDRELKVIHTPGHSPGHICIFEEKTGYLFTGDLVYKGKIDVSYESTDPSKYMKSIEKVSRLKVKKVLPGHFNLNVDSNIIFDILKALKKFDAENKLKHGSGLFEFNDFKLCF